MLCFCQKQVQQLPFSTDCTAFFVEAEWRVAEPPILQTLFHPFTHLLPRRQRTFVHALSKPNSLAFKRFVYPARARVSMSALVDSGVVLYFVQIEMKGGAETLDPCTAWSARRE